MTPRHAAVDLGASNGRVMVGTLASGALVLSEVHRFPNSPVELPDGLYTDAVGLYSGILEGLRLASRDGGITSVGIDSWGVDYGRFDADGRLLGSPRHYRDQRTQPRVAELSRRISEADAYAVTGTQSAFYNSVYQFLDDLGSSQWPLVRQLLFTPDLFGYWLSGEVGTEVTIASTSGMLDPARRSWAPQVAAAAGVDLRRFAPLQEPGLIRGRLRRDLVAGQPALVVVGGHDTASAVAAVPAADQHFAYISCGTWSIVGVELASPLTSPEAMAAGYTNELGVDHTVRFNRNLTGLWLLQECQRAWSAEGRTETLTDLLTDAAAARPLASVVNAADPLFMAPGGMPARIARAAAENGQPTPREPGEIVRCVLDSLAIAHARAVRSVRELTGKEVRVVHVIGGGSRNELLCQLTADACGLPVIAGPVEAAALGNVAIQARAMGTIHGDLTSLRRLVAASGGVRRYVPSGTTGAWRAAEGRL